ncbi:N-alpha-acetyltransferase 15, NatA auxiliary subunit [Homalodisca vitripennis]|nr:N-alpha-acetyltransferase 15, NatA auxiliary subunit [Homalodisca vitripennis]
MALRLPDHCFSALHNKGTCTSQLVVVRDILFAVAENLAPSELKKLRNKQRKARRKAELEKAQAVAVAEKREQHKSRQADTETDAPPQDELVPDKLAKVQSLTSQSGVLTISLPHPSSPISFVGK